MSEIVRIGKSEYEVELSGDNSGRLYAKITWAIDGDVQYIGHIGLVAPDESPNSIIHRFASSIDGYIHFLGSLSSNAAISSWWDE